MSLNLITQKYVSSLPNTGTKLSSRKNLGQDIAAGISQLGLHYFPDVKFWNDQRHKGVSWDGLQVLLLIGHNSKEDISYLAEKLTDDVKVNLHSAGLMYKTSVGKLDHVVVFPWMKQVSAQIVLIKVQE